MLPTPEEFGYSMRVVSEITESNGSSSMASVCGGSLALMDAGVPMKAHVAGIAMGLIKEGNRFAVLSDILGDEDHLGDMDFKVAGTDAGVTALQMDIKIQGITKEIMQVALNQAREGRAHILSLMKQALQTPRTEISAYAPRMIIIKIKPEKIRDVIGKGGAVIRAITEETGTTIDIGEDGTVTIACTNSDGGWQRRSVSKTLRQKSRSVVSMKGPFSSCWTSAPSLACCPVRTDCCTSHRLPTSESRTWLIILRKDSLFETRSSKRTTKAGCVCL